MVGVVAANDGSGRRLRSDASEGAEEVGNQRARGKLGEALVVSVAWLEVPGRHAGAGGGIVGRACAGT